MEGDGKDNIVLDYVLLNKSDVFVYKIPARPPQGHRAEDWKDCIWRGRMQIVSRGNGCTVNLVDTHNSKLFAKCPVTENYEQSVERTVDSSRYFVLRVDDGHGRHAFIGMGFDSRNDAFDFNCALSDYARRRQVEKHELSREGLGEMPQRDYSLKEGQKIKVELKGLKSRSRQRSGVTGGQFPDSLTNHFSSSPITSSPIESPTASSSFSASGSLVEVSKALQGALVPPPPMTKNRGGCRREKSPFDCFSVNSPTSAESNSTSPELSLPSSSSNSHDPNSKSGASRFSPPSSAIFSNLIPKSPTVGSTPPVSSAASQQRFSGSIEQDLLDLEFTDFQTCTVPADVDSRSTANAISATAAGTAAAATTATSTTAAADTACSLMTSATVSKSIAALSTTDPPPPLSSCSSIDPFASLPPFSSPSFATDYDSQRNSSCSSNSNSDSGGSGSSNIDVSTAVADCSCASTTTTSTTSPLHPLTSSPTVGVSLDDAFANLSIAMAPSASSVPPL